MKIQTMLTSVLVLLVLVVGQNSMSNAVPISKSFTYQGRLRDAETPADGLYDFQFRLFDYAGDIGISTPPLGTIDLSEINVIDGYFTVELDFGDEVFDGNAIWLEIGVRPGDMNDPNLYTILSPRQEITPTPYALTVRAPLSLVSDSSEPTISGTATAQYGGIGVYGEATQDDAYGVYGKVTGVDSYGVYGEAVEEDSEGVFGNASGQANSGVVGKHIEAQTTGRLGDSVYGVGVYGEHWTSSNFGSTRDNYGYLGGAIHGVYGGTVNPDNYAGYFDGQAKVTENLIVDGNVGIGTDTPGAKLEVNGRVKIIDGSQESGKVLTSDADGLAGWQTADDGDWKVSGDNIYSGVSGNIGIGTWLPSSKLEIAGQVKAHGFIANASILKIESFDDIELKIDSTNGPVYSFLELFNGKGNNIWWVNEDGNMRVSGNATVDGQVHVPDMQVAASSGAQVQWLGGLYGGMLVRAASSARYKDNIEPLRDDFYKILKANPRSFNCKTTGQRGIGFIAEEFDELGLCNLVTYDQEGRPDAIDYKLISIYLLEIIKDQVQTTDRLKAEHESLKQKNQSLEQRLEILERAMVRHNLAVAKEVQK